MLNRLRKLRRNNRGVAAIEFALLLPVLIALMIGCLEVTFKIWSTQKAEKLVGDAGRRHRPVARK